MVRLKHFNLNLDLTCNTHCTCRPVHKRLKEYNRVIWFSQTQTSAISEHANNTGHYLPAAGATQSRLSSLTQTLTGTLIGLKRLLKFTEHPKNINRDSRIKIPLRVEAYMVRKHTQQGMSQNQQALFTNQVSALIIRPPYVLSITVKFILIN